MACDWFLTLDQDTFPGFYAEIWHFDPRFVGMIKKVSKATYEHCVTASLVMQIVYLMRLPFYKDPLKL